MLNASICEINQNVISSSDNNTLLKEIGDENIENYQQEFTSLLPSVTDFPEVTSFLSAHVSL